MTLERLHQLGFDNSRIYDSDGEVYISCSKCQPMVINGVPCHEHGCPNQTAECKECGARIPKGHRLCESCANPEPEPECPESPDGRHNFIADLEYDETGESETCEHCGDIRP